jgi:hypothetical protein
MPVSGISVTRLRRDVSSKTLLLEFSHSDFDVWNAAQADILSLVYVFPCRHMMTAHDDSEGTQGSSFDNLAIALSLG